jgi:biopolymer transport protein ExbD
MRSTWLLYALLMGGLVAAAEPSVSIRLTSHQTCQIDDEEVPCADVGAKLRAKHVPQHGDVHLIADPKASYEQISGALALLSASLRDAGYNLKIGYVTTGNE